MKAWSLFYPDVLPDLPQAPWPIVDHYLRNAAIEFCERSKCNVVRLTDLDSVAEQMSYAITLAENTELVEINSVRYLGEKLDAAAPVFLERKYDDWETEVGTPEYYTQADTLNVMLVPAPADANTAGIRIRAAVKPGPAATGVDDWLFSEYRLAICAGAKAKMMAELSKPWSNPDLVALNQGIFDGAIEAATVRATDGMVKSRPRFSGSFC